MSVDSKATRERVCFNALSAVFRDGAYSAQALSGSLSAVKCDDSEFVTRLFYGVLERNLTLEYILSKLVDKRPKPAVFIILKMGTYMLRYMDTPDYAAVDGCVRLAKELGKAGASGFVNAVLRAVSGVPLPKIGSVSEREYLSVNCGLPLWLADAFMDEYGFAFTADIVKSEEFRTHIRLNRCADRNSFEKALSTVCDLDESKTKYGYYVTHKTLDKLISDKILTKKDYAVQSLASVAATHCYADGLNVNSKVLDLCAAPGGKTVCLAELLDCDITACDIHEHRLELIRSYVKRMGVKVSTELNDACVDREAWHSTFDCVICDVPCSGTGDLRSRPDILLRRTLDGVRELSALQSRILRRAATYVKVGGKLCYSTCSLLQSENEDVVSAFLEHNDDFELLDCKPISDGMAKIDAANLLNQHKDKNGLRRKIDEKAMKLFPHIHDTDGFFAVTMRRKAGAKS